MNKFFKLGLFLSMVFGFSIVLLAAEAEGEIECGESYSLSDLETGIEMHAENLRLQRKYLSEEKQLEVQDPDQL